MDRHSYATTEESTNNTTLSHLIDPRFHYLLSRSSLKIAPAPNNFDPTKLPGRPVEASYSQMYFSSDASSNSMNKSTNQPNSPIDNKARKENFTSKLTRKLQSVWYKKNVRMTVCAYMLICILCIALIVIPIALVFGLPKKGTTATSTVSAAAAITTTNRMLRWNATGITVAGITSSASTALNRLDWPFTLVLDSSNTLYIVDQQNNRVQKWLSGASVGTTVAGQSSGTSGSTVTDLDQPSGLILDASNNIYVTDTNNNRVQLWSNGASSGTTVAGILGSGGSGNNELAAPFGIARDASSGTLYIVDQSNHRVMSYLSGASSGTVVAGGNGPGTSNTQLNFPVGIYFDSSSNSLYVANAGAHNIVRWVLGASSWTLVAGSSSGVSGNTLFLLNYPVGVTLDSMGNVYVADRDNHRIQLFLAGQSNGTTIAGATGTSGSNATLLFRPCSVALDTQLNLYVADTYNSRVQKFIRY